MIQTIDQINPEGKTVLLRVDFNSPIEPEAGVILDDKRFREHIRTIKALDNAKCVIITHQSRPGKKDFTSLEAHAKRLEQLLSKPVRFVDDIFGSCAREAVREMKNGDVLMLENVRFSAEENLKISGEEAAKTMLVKRLSRMGDIFVNDAFGTAHRSQPTLVGLPEVMSSAAGLLMEKEIKNLSRVFQGSPKPVSFILGGTKVDDSITVLENSLEKGLADRVFVIGVVANVFMAAEGYNIGRPSNELIKKLGYESEIEHAKDLMKRFGDRIFVPDSVAIKRNGKREDCSVSEIPDDCPVLDIGKESVPVFVKAIKESGTVVFNGPAGLFEEADFADGTYELINAASEVEFSVVGGGHTAAMIEKMGYESRFTHISTGGGACIEFLTGKKLPAIEALEKSAKRFH